MKPNKLTEAVWVVFSRYSFRDLAGALRFSLLSSVPPDECRSGI
jgi:hypothetical protein